MTDKSKVILRNLQYNEEFVRRVIPFFKKEFFETEPEQIYFECIDRFFQKYNSLPSKEAIDIDINSLKINNDLYKELLQISDDFYAEKSQPINVDWLVDEAEIFVQDKSISLALMSAVEIAAGENKSLSKTAIPDILQKACGVTFDQKLGHDYFDDAESRYEYYHKKAAKLKFHLDCLNHVTNGGAEFKTLNCVLAATGGGKSIFLCDLASGYIELGYNVLYISLELAEEKIGQRLDANMMDVNINELDKLSKEKFMEKIASIKAKSKGKLVFKEYPTSSAHVGHFRYLLQELKSKKSFVPQVIIVDYIGICASSIVKDASNTNTYLKSITQELRGLAVEKNVCMWSAMQFNRSGAGNTGASITDIAASFDSTNTFDFLFSIINTEELTQMGQVIFSQEKSRYGEMDTMKKFTVGLDKLKMRFYDLNSTQTKVVTQTVQKAASKITPVTSKNTKGKIIV